MHSTNRSSNEGIHRCGATDCTHNDEATCTAEKIDVAVMNNLPVCVTYTSDRTSKDEVHRGLLVDEKTGRVIALD